MTQGSGHDEELVREVVAEALEGAEAAMAGLLELESDPQDLSAVADVFRRLHSIKGIAAMVGLDGVSSFAHSIEDALDRVRQRDRAASPEEVALLIEGVDLLLELLGAVDCQAVTETIEPSHEAFLQRLAACFPEDSEEAADRPLSSVLASWMQQAEASPSFADHPMFAELKGLLAQSAPAHPQETAEAQCGSAPKSPVGSRATSASESAPPGLAAEQSHSILRVNIASIDNLVEIAGGLFHIDERLKHLMRGHESSIQRTSARDGLKEVARDFDAVMSRLYEQLLGIRKVSVAQVTRPLERIVRAVCRTQGKRIRLLVSGQEIRLDKQVLETLQDPLVHLVRNAVDHGIESPEERLSTGKPEEGHVEIAVQEGEESIVVTVSDDGKGIDVGAVRAKALSQGRIGSDQAQQMTEQALIELAFQPGLSTAQEVSGLSGRGVGLDVVIRNVRDSGGTVTTQTESGVGTAFTIELPKSGSPLVDGLVVRIGDITYLLPVKAVQRFVPWDECQVTRLPNGRFVATVAEARLPLAQLDGLRDRRSTCDESVPVAMIIEDRAGRRCALAADQVLDRQKALVTNGYGDLERCAIVTGEFLLGDGTIGFAVCVDSLVDSVCGHQV